jgi:hypothetical protein
MSSWFPVPGSWFPVPGSWFPVPGSWFPENQPVADEEIGNRRDADGYHIGDQDGETCQICDERRHADVGRNREGAGRDVERQPPSGSSRARLAWPGEALVPDEVVGRGSKHGC